MAQRSGAGPPAQWPPRSPHEALASTPSGRERMRRMAEPSSPSPSPLKRARSMSALAARSAISHNNMDDEDIDVDMEDEEDDEETLQLKLQAIQAKLKLKAFQRRQKQAGGSMDLNNSTTMRPSPGHDNLAVSRTQSRAAMLKEATKALPQSQAEVQVPVSPVRRTQTAQSERSPSRVLLGIDKGLKAKDVSLKRASSQRGPRDGDGPSSGYLQRSRTPAANQENLISRDRPKSFSERLAEARSEEAAKKERQDRIRTVRNDTFQVKQEEVERYKSQAVEIPEAPSEQGSYSREEILAGGRIKRSNTVPSIRRGDNIDGEGGPANSEEAASFEPYSALHLSKRILPHSVLARTLSGKKPYLIKDLLACVKAPNFELPDIEQDIVVLGIVASKSDPKAHKPPPGGSDLKEKKNRFADDNDPRGKYMVIQLVDLTWQLDLFLFDSAFARYWKLSPGREDTGRFSIVLNSDGDTVLEIGTARDLGYCKSVKKDGNLCNSWVNKKRTEFCEFHMNAALEKHRFHRQDINSAAGSGMGARPKNHREKWQNDNMKKSNTSNYDRASGSQYYVSHASAASLIDGEHLAFGGVADRAERKEALRRRLEHQEKEREIMKQLSNLGRGAGREYMKMTDRTNQLGSSVSSAGGTAQDSPSMSQTPAYDAKSLGLVAPRGADAKKVHLSPVKRKRNLSSFNSMSSTGSSTSSAKAAKTAPATQSKSEGALGWGTSLKDKLSNMKNGQRFDGAASAAPAASSSFSDGGSSFQSSVSLTPAIKGKDSREKAELPARKKTRFVTEKGIREAGRESLGGDFARNKMVLLDDGEDDDELVVLK
ncbi:minichromosome maintenance protein 10 [Apiospora rasikravindrae]|uniref:Minichromosome maintenance protein 10 n=1 Tax=Apiospora rasikravindrae TaxID=990691 RepID=A0ABR1TGQ6_9PEZI